MDSIPSFYFAGPMSVGLWCVPYWIPPKLILYSSPISRLIFTVHDGIWGGRGDQTVMGEERIGRFLLFHMPLLGFWSSHESSETLETHTLGHWHDYLGHAAVVQRGF